MLVIKANDRPDSVHPVMKDGIVALVVDKCAFLNQTPLFTGQCDVDSVSLWH